MKYLVRKSYVEVIGQIWMPADTAATRYDLTGYDIENVRAYGEGTISRDAVELWLGTHAGDFSSVTDFAASIEDPDTDETIDIPWKSEDSEVTFSVCMYGDED